MVLLKLVPKVVHRLDQVADTGDLRSGEVTQIVNPNTLWANDFQCRRQRVADNLVGQVTAAREPVRTAAPRDRADVLI